MSEIVFKPLAAGQLSLIKQWFRMPHVKQWWHLSDEEIEDEYSSEYLGKVTFAYIVYCQNQPIGFIQYYYVNKAGDGWWPDELEDSTVGIDQFIADENYLNKGLGSRILNSFVELIAENPLHKKIILDVKSSNPRAIRCYEKVGFHYLKEIMTPDGLANQMEYVF